VTEGALVAVDLGAASGRVIAGSVGPARLELQELRRFPNGPVARPDGLHWDVAELRSQVMRGLGQAARLPGGIRSVGIDSWGVDYGLLDSAGALHGEPFHYRDPGTAEGVERVRAIVSPGSLYARTGIQFLPFNTIYQLAARRADAQSPHVRTWLMIPDLFGYWLTGVAFTELTNASTTGLLNARTRTWDRGLLTDLGLRPEIFPEPRRPGERIGPLRVEIKAELGLGAETDVVVVGSHDTASAVVAVPAEGDRFAYVASGTWSLVGVELEAPVLSEASRAANFTNEIGVDGRVRYLRNVMGLWLLQESMRTWHQAGLAPNLDELVEAAGALPAGGPVVDADLAAFLPPGNMPERIADACQKSNQPVPASQAAFVRCILDSLAVSHARAVADAKRLTGRAVDVIHLVGGGARNALLCQLTADACQRPVVAGPVEATAIGNILVQARAVGMIEGDLDSLRAIVRATQELRRFEPRPSDLSRAVEPG
jgi:rhamnulokinase